MKHGTFLACGLAMTVVAVAVRLHNVWTESVLGGYDAFAHFSYIWFLADTGRVPLADTGWEFFQPPLYYALMAIPWTAMDGVDGVTRLRAGTTLVALLGLIPVAVAVTVVRRRLPDERVVQLTTAGLMLFLPMHIYSAGFVGNEALNAVLGAVAFAVLLRTLEHPSHRNAAALGLVLGLAMLTKFTGVVAVATGLGTVALKGVRQRNVRGAARLLAVASAVLLAVCGWYYARNILLYGTPFRLSRDQLFLSRVENSQLQGERNFLEYVLFDPGILYRPQWPRGLSLNSPRPPGTGYSALRESIPTGLYANAWFDGYGGVALPPVTGNEASRRAGQLLLTLATIPTAVTLLGLALALRNLRRRGWDDMTVATLVALAAIEAVLIHGTRSVPTQAAVKATYLMPISVAFAFLFALGLEHLGRRAPRMRNAVVAACAVLMTASALVFTRGLAIDDEWFRTGERSSPARNLYGVIAYAAGDPESAAGHFRESARGGWHLGYENLAAIALDEGDPASAEWFLQKAAALQPFQTRGSVDERRRANATAQAEYANSRSVILQRLGRNDEALDAAETAIRRDPSIPESHYDAGVLRLLLAVGRTADVARAPRELLEKAERALARSVELDPAFREAETMRGVSLALLGDCDAARPLLERSPSTSTPGSRAYPIETGPGDRNAAGLQRRRRIEGLPSSLSAESALQNCRRS